MTFTDAQVALLQAKLDKAHVKKNPKGYDYVEGWWAISEANRIFGHDAWNRETVLLQETSRDLVHIKGFNGKADYDQWRVSYIAKVRITVGTVIREGTGYGNGMGKPEAIGDAIEGAIKEAETDAMKRALMTFGNPFGLALYDKAQANVETTPPAAPKAGPGAKGYLGMAQTFFDEMCFSESDIKEWWKNEADNRAKHNIVAGTPEYDQLGQMVKDHRAAIQQKEAA